MEEGHGVISRVKADFADRRDSTLLPSIVEPLRQRLLAHDLPVSGLLIATGIKQDYAKPFLAAFVLVV